MRTNNFPKSLAGLTLVALGVIADGSAAADTQAAQTLAVWLWAYGLPGWLSAALVVVLFGGVAWLGLALYRRPGAPSKRGGLYAALGGGLLGAVVALLAAGPWESYLVDHLRTLPPTSVGPASGWSPDLLDAAVPGDVAGAPRQPAKVIPGRVRHARVNTSSLDAASLVLNLFDDTQFIAVRDRVDQSLAGGTAWVGHIEGEPNGEVVLAVKGGVVMGTVDLGERFFEIVYVGGSTHAVRELNPNELPGRFEPTAMDTDAAATTPVVTAVGSAAATSSSGQVIDLMVVYTPRARGNAGGFTGIETRIMNAVTRANQAYMNSRINLQLRLVYLGEISYTETGDMAVALADLVGTGDGKLDTVHLLRNLNAADLVTLVDADANYCGAANTLPALSTAFSSWSAFSVVHDDSVHNCLGSNNTLAHEVGHGLGNLHDPEHSGLAKIVPAGYGYRRCGAFRDLMSYPCTTEARIPYFANPNVLYNGEPTGVPGLSDLAAATTAAAPTVASFRTGADLVALPAAPGSLTDTVAGADAVTLAWTSSGDHAAGYRLEGAVDGGDWVQIASLGPNVLAFTDTGLLTGHTYSYRVYAYNGLGNSPYSNTAYATATGPNVDITPPRVTISNPGSGATVSGVVTVSLSATDEDAINGLKLYVDDRLVGVTNAAALDFSWDTQGIAGGSHTLKGIAIDIAGNTGTATLSVTIP